MHKRAFSCSRLNLAHLLFHGNSNYFSYYQQNLGIGSFTVFRIRDFFHLTCLMTFFLTTLKKPCNLCKSSVSTFCLSSALTIRTRHHSSHFLTACSLNHPFRAATKIKPYSKKLLFRKDSQLASVSSRCLYFCFLQSRRSVHAAQLASHLFVSSSFLSHLILFRRFEIKRYVIASEAAHQSLLYSFPRPFLCNSNIFYQYQKIILYTLLSSVL